MTIKMNKITDVFLITLISSGLILQICFAYQAIGASCDLTDQSSCSEQLDQAEELYYNGDFDVAVGLVQECLKSKSVDKQVLVRAYTILSRIYLTQGNQVSAKENINHILSLNPTYNPTIEEETPSYVNLVSEVRQEVVQAQVDKPGAPSDSSAISPWVWVGLGSAAVAIIALIASGNGDSNQDPEGGQPLPEPPSYPDSR